MNKQIYEELVSCRLDLFLSKVANCTRRQAKEAIEAGLCQIDDKTIDNPATKIKKSQTLTWSLAFKASELVAEEGDLEIVYADDYLAVINKKAGLTVHPCPSCQENTLVQQLLTHFPKLAKLEGLRPGIVHRLDKDTSGLIVIALSEEVRIKLSDDFANRQVGKTYLALVDKVPAPSGTIDLPLGRDPKSKIKMAVVPENKGGRTALTSWDTLYADPNLDFALLEVTIHTGRTHQIRVHFAQQGHALLGDQLYNMNKIKHAKRQMLHSYKLSFTHPITQEVFTFCSPPPADFLDCMLNIPTLCQKIVVVGGIGSGKSSLTKLFAESGYPVFNADQEVNKLYQAGADAWVVLDKFYNSRFTPDPKEPVDKQALAKAMQDDPSFSEDIERFVHPLIAHRLEEFWRENQNAKRAIAEIPLYFESKQMQKDHLIIVVNAPLEQRLARVQAERKWSVEKFGFLEAKQMSEAQKNKLASYILKNDSDLDSLDNKYQELIQVLDNFALKEKNKIKQIYLELGKKIETI